MIIYLSKQNIENTRLLQLVPKRIGGSIVAISLQKLVGKKMKIKSKPMFHGQGWEKKFESVLQRVMPEEFQAGLVKVQYVPYEYWENDDYSSGETPAEIQILWTGPASARPSSGHIRFDKVYQIKENEFDPCLGYGRLFSYLGNNPYFLMGNWKLDPKINSKLLAVGRVLEKMAARTRKVTYTKKSARRRNVR